MPAPQHRRRAAAWVARHFPELSKARRAELIDDLTTLLQENDTGRYVARAGYYRDYARGRKAGATGRPVEVDGSEAYLRGHAAGARARAAPQK